MGSEGFIGSHVIKYLKDRGWELFGCDLYDVPTQDYRYTKISRLSPEWEEIIVSTPFDVCVNAAGSGSVPYSITHPFNDFESNAIDTMRILDYIRRHRPSCKYLHISSAAVYGNPVALPVREDAPAEPLSPYGWHKLIAEQLCYEYTEFFHLKTAIIRPFSVYGPGLHKQLFWDTYQKYLSGNGTIELWGTGRESRDFVYIEDLAQAIFCILERAPMNGEIYNIASGEETTIQEAIDLFLGFFDRPCISRFNQKVREGDPLNWRADIGKITSLEFRSAVPIREGLKRTCQWMQSLPAN